MPGWPESLTHLRALKEPHTDGKVGDGEHQQGGQLVNDLIQARAQGEHLVERHHGVGGRQEIVDADLLPRRG